MPIKTKPMNIVKSCKIHKITSNATSLTNKHAIQIRIVKSILQTLLQLPPSLVRASGIHSCRGVVMIGASGHMTCYATCLKLQTALLCCCICMEAWVTTQLFYCCCSAAAYERLCVLAMCVLPTDKCTCWLWAALCKPLQLSMH